MTNTILPRKFLSYILSYFKISHFFHLCHTGKFFFFCCAENDTFFFPFLEIPEHLFLKKKRYCFGATKTKKFPVWVLNLNLLDIGSSFAHVVKRITFTRGIENWVMGILPYIQGRRIVGGRFWASNTFQVIKEASHEMRLTPKISKMRVSLIPGPLPSP